jgi:phage recombination protein Bet
MANAVAKKSEPVPVPAATQAVQGRVSLMARIADRYSVDPDKMKATLIATAFRQRPAKEGKEPVVVSDEQLMMLLIVADQYKLNPFTKEIYAFPSELGIVPIISVDGWIRIINERPELKSIQFEYAPEGTDPKDAWIGCIIERHDRNRPIEIREYLAECYRDTGPWKSHSRRMLRHKALIQCARIAFGFAGVFDPDEGERIVSVVDQVHPQISGKPETRAPQARVKHDAAPPADPEIQRITMDQATAIADKLKEEGVALERFLAHVGLKSIEDIDARGYASAFEAIDELSR